MSDKDIPPNQVLRRTPNIFANWDAIPRDAHIGFDETVLDVCHAHSRQWSLSSVSLGSMRLATFIAVFLLGLNAKGASLDLDGWAGKYSHDTDTHGHTLFQVPTVHAALSHLLTKQDLKRLTDTYSVSAPISLIQGFLIVPQCMPHCCPCEHAMLVIDLRRGVFHVGFYKREAKKVTIQWFSSEGEFQALPKEIQDEFYYSHNPK